MRAIIIIALLLASDSAYAAEVKTIVPLQRDPVVVSAVIAALVGIFSGVATSLVTLLAVGNRGKIDRNLADRRADFEIELQKKKADLDEKLKIADGRIPAYKTLWRCMSSLSPIASAPLNAIERDDLDLALRQAYYNEGAGMLLSHAAMSKYEAAVRALNAKNYNDADARKKFSGLRTQMKKDLSIYTDDEAATPI